MWQKTGKLFLFLMIILLVEAGAIPAVVPWLKVDLFIGMIMGLVLFCEFTPGLCFVLAASLLFQAFTGAHTGYLPFVYTITYLTFDLMRSFIYLENRTAQTILGALCYLLIIIAAVFFTDVYFSWELLPPLLCGALLSGLSCPPLVWIMGHMKVEHEF